MANSRLTRLMSDLVKRNGSDLHVSGDTVPYFRIQGAILPADNQKYNEEDLHKDLIEILGEDKKSANYTIVNSKVIPDDGGPEIVIDWRIYTKNPDKPLIRDLIVEGLSLARTQKEEFSSILNSNDGNIEILFKTLKDF